MAVHIRTKIITSFSIILSLLSILGFIAYYNRNILFDGMLEVEDKTYELGAIANIQLNIDRVVMPPNDYLITGDLREKERFQEISGLLEKDFKVLVGQAGNGHINSDKMAQERFNLLKAKAGEIFTIKNPVGNKKGAILMEKLDAIASEIITNDLSKSLEVINHEVKARTTYAGTARKKADVLLSIGGILSLITVVALISYLSRSILRPILEFREGAFIIGEGNLDYRIDIKDGIEINVLANEFNKMTAKLKESYAGLEKKVEERTSELNDVNVKLQELSITDGLTGAFNHRYFYGKLTEEIKRAERYCHPLSIIMSDIDYFKDYNDAHGHVAGDSVLKGVVSCIRRNVREQDMVARYGGEEFSVILPETGKKVAVDVAERIRRCLQAQAISRKDTQPGGSLTISLGIAAFPDDAADPKGLIEKADAALYKAKENGRNRVEEA
ncbi:MAG: diguanylate cyclase [Deltaproteobacteria bacterium]|nr:diguanylate cyclase [Deltaproteobacteria bacterium]